MNLDSANLSVILDVLNNGKQIVLPAEFKLSLNYYLSDLTYSPVHSLAEIIAVNNAHPIEVCSTFFKLYFSIYFFHTTLPFLLHFHMYYSGQTLTNLILIVFYSKYIISTHCLRSANFVQNVPAFCSSSTSRI